MSLGEIVVSAAVTAVVGVLVQRMCTALLDLRRRGRDKDRR